MTMQMINATITGIERISSQAGSPAIRISCNHPDGSKWDDGRDKGKRVTDWIGWETAPEFVFKRWAHLVEPNCDTERAKQILAGDDWRLIGMEVQLEVDTSGQYGWDVKSVKTLTESLEPTTASVIDDDIEIPF